MPAKLRTAVIDEFRDIGRAAADAAALADAGAAVMASRYALRRARAIWEMLDDALPGRVHREGADAIHEARRALSWSPFGSRAKPLFDALELGDRDRTTTTTLLANATALLPPITEVASLLADAAACVATQASVLESVLEEDLDWEPIVDGIRVEYRDTRDKRSDASSRDDFSSWRRRVKELAIELAFVAAQTGPRVGELRASFDETLRAASSAVDLVMLREFAKSHANGVSEDDLDALVDALDKPWKKLRNAALKLGRDAFSEKPKRFAKALAAAIRDDAAAT